MVLVAIHTVLKPVRQTAFLSAVAVANHRSDREHTLVVVALQTHSEPCQLVEPRTTRVARQVEDQRRPL